MRPPFVNSGNEKDAESEIERMTLQVNTGYHNLCIFIDKQGTIPKKDGDPLESKEIEGFQTSWWKILSYGRGIFFLKSVMDMSWYFVHYQCVLSVSDLIPLSSCIYIHT